MTSYERNQLRLDTIMTSNSKQCPSVKNMEVMSTSSWGSAQHVEQ